MRNRYRALATSVALVGLLVTQPARAGNLIGLAREGVPVRWDPAQPVVYRVDQGSLGTLNNAQATQFVRDAIAAWGGIQGASLNIVEGAPLGVDVTKDNFLDYYFNSITGSNIVVFDADGSIFEQLGVGDATAGLGGYKAADPDTGHITEALILLNGRVFDGISDSGAGNLELTEAQFRSTIVHELGHFLGLGHSDLNGTSAFTELVDIPGFGIAPLESVETMFAFINTTGLTPQLDDISTYRRLYGTGTLSSYSAITGEVRDPDGFGLAGINVFIRDPADPYTTAASTISGAETRNVLTGAAAGQFTIPGLVTDVPMVIGVTEAGSGVFAQPIRTGFIGVGSSSVLGLYYGVSEYYSEPETELDDPTRKRAIIPDPGPVGSAILLTMNNIEEILPAAGDPIAEVGGNQARVTAQAVPFPATIIGTAIKSDVGEMVFDPGNGQLDDIEDYFAVTLPADKRTAVFLEPLDGTCEDDLELFLFSTDHNNAIRLGASAGSVESFRIWNVGGPFVIGVSSSDRDLVRPQTPYILTIAESALPRSGLTVATLIDVASGYRHLDESELAAADRTADGSIDAADVLRQSISPALVQQDPW